MTITMIVISNNRLLITVITVMIIIIIINKVVCIFSLFYISSAKLTTLLFKYAKDASVISQVRLVLSFN